MCIPMCILIHTHVYVSPIGEYIHTHSLRYTSMTDLWLRSILIDKGLISEAGLSRNAGIRTCRTCRTSCLAGIAITGLDTWLEPHQLHRYGELHALLDCRRTFSLYAGKQLVPRDQHWISNYPAGHAKRPTFATHTCGQPIPTTWTTKGTP